MRRYRPVLWLAIALWGAGTATSTLGQENQEKKTATTTAVKADQPPPEDCTARFGRRESGSSQYCSIGIRDTG